MKYAIELYFAKETENKLLGLAQRIADEKISGKYTEIGLVNYISGRRDFYSCVELIGSDLKQVAK